MVWEVAVDTSGPAAMADWELDDRKRRPDGRGYSEELARVKWPEVSTPLPIPDSLVGELPTEVTLVDAGKTLPDVMGGGWYYVSKRFKSILEEFEPDNFQFFPVHLTGKLSDGTAVDEIYYICHNASGMHDILEQVDFEQSDLTWVPPPRVPVGMKRPPGAPTRLLSRTGGYKLTFLKDKVANLHYWQCRGSGTSLFAHFMSDDLMARLEPFSGLEKRHHPETRGIP